MMDQSDAGHVGIFSQWTNQTLSPPNRTLWTLRRVKVLKSKLFERDNQISDLQYQLSAAEDAMKKVRSEKSTLCKHK
eukprot:1191038-Prorocentrum_minimum.AAC.2